MVVGEPTLMGGEFGDEDERLITRLENQQFETNGGGPGGEEEKFNPNSPALQGPPPHSNPSPWGGGGADKKPPLPPPTSVGQDGVDTKTEQ